MRPHQWVKNTFVLAPLVFSRNLTSRWHVQRALLSLLLFCVVSGAVYILNDLCDRESDRLHPAKAGRPIASGRLSVSHARQALLGLLVLGMVPAGLLNLPFVGVLSAYVLLNLAYSFFLKKVVFLDVVAIGLAFLLRVLGGATAIEVPISTWLIVCTFLLSLYLALGKRKHELLSIRDAHNTREVLGRYNLNHIKLAMAGVALVTAGCYLAYTLDPITAEHVGTGALVVTTPFIAIGLLRFYFLAQRTGVSRSPTEQMVKDPLFVANMLLWGGIVVVLIYA